MLSSFVAVDTETTGLDLEHDRVIELAAVRFEDGAPTATFSALLSPGDRALSPVSRLITGISDAELAAAPPAAESLRAFLDFVGDTPLVAHNAEFDAHFVRKTLAAAALPQLPGPWVDTLLLSRTAWPDWDSHRLDSLAQRLAVPRDDEHRALPDARRAGWVCLAAQTHLRRTLSLEARNALSRLAAHDPAWSLVFRAVEGADANENANENERGAADSGLTESASHDTGAAAAQTAETHGPLAAALDAAFDDALADALEAEVWTALETPAGDDDAAAALAAALRAARNGRRVLLAAPDTMAWNALRRTVSQAVDAAARDPHAAPQKRPRVVALAEPSGYLCRARLARVLDEPARIPAAERAALFPLVAWADRTRPDAPAEALAAGRGFSPERSRLTWSRLCCDTWDDDPGARAAFEAATHAGVVLVTHATLCAHVARVAQGLPARALLPAADTLIVTGAHRLPEGARSTAGLGRAVSYFRLRELLLVGGTPVEGNEDASADEDGTWRALTAALDEAQATAARAAWFEPEKLLQKFLQKAGRQAVKMRPQGDFRVRYAEPVVTAFDADPAPLFAALHTNEEFLERCAGTDPAAEGPASLRRTLLQRLRAFRADLAHLCDAGDAEAVYWFEDVANPHKAALRAAPRSLDSFAAALRDLFGGGVLASPALIAGASPAASAEAAVPSDRAGDARWFLEASGFGGIDPDADDRAVVRVRVRRVPGPVAGPRCLAVPEAPAIAAGEPPEAFARYLAEAARPFAAQGVLVFCPSQTALRALHIALRRALAEMASDDQPAPPLWAQYADGNRDALARLYAAGRGGYVLALEGLTGLRDADGNAPALWVVTRVPLPPLRDPLLEARAERMQEEGLAPRDARRVLWQPPAVLRLKRDFAALCRAATPPRALWLTDARAHGDGLGEKLAGALGVKAEVARGVEELQRKTGEAIG